LLLLQFLIAAAPNPDRLAAAEALLKSPTLDFPQALQARALYEEELASAPGPAGLLARLARVNFILGDLAATGQRENFYHSGLTAAERLAREQPGNVAGPYWTALNLCGLAAAGGPLQGRKLLPRILENLHRALALDETYDQAGAHRVLGRIYFEAPRWPLSVGDLQKSRRHLEAAVRLAPDVSTNHLYLAETLLKLNDRSQARRELEQVLTATRHAIQPRGLQEDQQEARRLLEEFKVK
jgi:tetratricopeptide (TPR) repeat protein